MSEPTRAAPPAADPSGAETIDTSSSVGSAGAQTGIPPGATAAGPSASAVTAAPGARTVAAAETIAVTGMAASAGGETVEPTQPMTLDHAPPGSSGGPETEAFDSAHARPRPARTARGPAPSAQAIPGFEIIQELGRGGMGVVYKARQLGLDRPVALKMILAGAHAGADQLERFTTEAQAIAQLQHPHIIQVHDIGECNGLPYFSLEFIDGGNLSERIGGKPMRPRDAAEMLLALARGMQAAHQKNIIHRDLKPANVLLTADGTPKITDFGLAKRLEADSQQTRTGAIMGTPSYMAPEQARGETRDIGPAADQYALGAILYEMLTGRPPFQGPTPLDTLEMARTQEPVPPTRLQIGIPRDLETICLKSLQKDPRKRYDDCGALADDLNRFLHGEPILARPVSAPERLWRWGLRHKAVALASAAAILAVLASIASLSYTALTLRAKNRDLARANNAANAAKQTAVEAQGVAENQREQAKQVAELAFKQGDFALNSLRYLSVLASGRLAGVPGATEIRAELLNTAERDLALAAQGMESVARQARDYQVIDDEMIGQTMVGIYMRLGESYADLGRFEDAGAAFEKMLPIAEANEKAHPESVFARKNLAYAQIAMGNFLMRQASRDNDAERLFRNALDIRREVLAAHPSADHRLDLAQSLGALARLYLNTDAARALKLYEEELQIRQNLPSDHADSEFARRELAGLYEMLGQTYFKLNEPRRGEEYLQRCLQLREELSDLSPESPYTALTTNRDLLLTYNRLGLGALLEQKDYPKARAYFQRALDGFLDLYATDPNNALIEGDLGMTRYYLGTACHNLNDTAAAREHFRACLELRRKQADENKAGKLKALRGNLMLALARCGHHAEAAQIANWLLAQSPRDAEDCYTAAGGLALSAAAATGTDLAAQYTDQAFEALRAALAAGFKNVGDLQIDPDLDPLRPDPRYPPLLEEFRQAAQQGG